MQMEHSSREAALAAYHRGGPDALALVRSALLQAPLDGGLLIAEATLLQEMRAPGATGRLGAMVWRAPDWLDGHVALARLLWGAGDGAFLEPLEQALAALPRHAGLWMRYMSLLAEGGRPDAAADRAARLRREGGDSPALRLIEAGFAGEAGQHERAQNLLARLPADLPGLAKARARQSLRINDPAAGAALLDRARADDPQDGTLWAMSELAWRATDDPRHSWLLPAGAFGCMEIGLARGELDELARTLDAIHDQRWPPLGQSARDGTQTRGHLRMRAEPIFALLFARLEQAVAAFAAGLPPVEQGHPLHAARGPELALRTAWSIRLRGEGRHVSHVHPHGTVSSAFWVQAPEDGGATNGALELGRPPADMALPIEPIAILTPKAGSLALFPSYLYHGTTPFSGGQRMSVAFDVGAGRPSP